jgi:hypothetical protein
MAAALVVAYLARNHHPPTSESASESASANAAPTHAAPTHAAPDFEPGYGPDTSADSGPELDAFTIEEFVEPVS